MWLWFKNFIGFKLSEDELHDVPHPYLELNIHILVKSMQAFLMGATMIGPAVAFYRSKSVDTELMIEYAENYSRTGAMIGGVLAPVMTFLRLRSVKADQAAVVDRCYRLRTNRSQLRVDRGSLLGAAGGAAVAVWMGGSACFGSLAGMFAGIVLMTVYNGAVRRGNEKKMK